MSRTRNTQQRRQALRRGEWRHGRRGSILILVVGVLVLLAISATVYVGVGRMDRLSSSAHESRFLREEAANQVVAHIGRILALDLFSNDDYATRPFQPSVDRMQSGPFEIGERWDYPMTRPGDASQFNLLADPWLASSEPVRDPSNPGRNNVPEIWRHISNIHPDGKFVDLAKFFGPRGFYGNLFIGGPSTQPYQLDTFNPEMRVIAQIDDLDATSDGYVTLADRRYGADTDGDGFIDSRWTELSEVYGMPGGMRYFVATRIVDMSSMVDVNTSVELGLDSSDDANGTAGTGEFPCDIDLYSMLWEEYLDLAGGAGVLEQDFIDDGFAIHLRRSGMLDAATSDMIYGLNNRLSPTERAGLYLASGDHPYEAHRGVWPYDVTDEIELRYVFSTSNDRAESRLERHFDGLNSGSNPATWLSPLRNRYPNEVDYAANLPTALDTVKDARHLLTTYNGSVPVSAWNLGGSTTSHGIIVKPDPTVVFDPADDQLATGVGAFMWALAPYAVAHQVIGSQTLNIYGSVAQWAPPAGQQYNYGDGDASFAMTRSGMLAVNAVDWLDLDSEPAIRRLSFLPPGSGIGFQTQKGLDLYGRFPHGDNTLATGTPNVQFTLIGFERQPFFREISTMVIYFDPVIDNPPVDDITPNDIYEDLVAFELGNPWDDDLDLTGYSIQFGTHRFNLDGTLGPGEYIVLYAASSPRGGSGPPVSDPIDEWEATVRARTGGATDVRRIATVNIDISLTDDEAILWRDNAPYGEGGAPVSVVVDRIRAHAADNSKFPNVLPGPIDYNKNSPLIPDGWFQVHTASMRRYCDRPGGGLTVSESFPAYVFQSPTSIGTNGRGSNVKEQQTIGQIDPPPGLVDSGVLSNTVFLNDPSEAKGYGLGQETDFAPFQFHMPALGGTFQSPVDLLLLPSVCHVNVGKTPADMAVANKYLTVSEYLGDEALYSHFATMGYDPAFATTGLRDMLRPAGLGLAGAPPMPDFRLVDGQPNPFVGKLDYTRFIPRDGSNKALPDVAIPLAARVVDAFETVPVDVQSPLVAGRININTASDRVLKLLPYLYPRYKAGNIPAATPSNPATDLQMARVISAYRDRQALGVMNWASSRWDGSGLKLGSNSGLRDDRTLVPNGPDAGFVSLAELPLLTLWQADGSMYKPDPNPSLLRQSMVRLGFDTQNLDFDPMDINASSDPGWRADYDPRDDIAERLALARAISNCVSVRSDVYVVYLTLIGFTPADIKAAEEESNRSGLPELEVLRPTMEQRYMFVLDRSNVKVATDRPRLLFAVQEVPSP